MKRILFTTTAVVALSLASLAFAQTAVVIEPGQQTTVRQYIVTQRVQPITMEADVAVGATLPGNVEMVTVPDEWGPTLTPYRYVYSNNQVYLVNPSDRRVIGRVEANR